MRRLIIAGLVAGLVGPGLIACSGGAAGEREESHPNHWQPRTRALDRTLVAGTLIEARIDRSVSLHNKPGEVLVATVSADVRNARRQVVVPAGCPVELRIALGEPAANTGEAPARMLFDVTSLIVSGRIYPLNATVELTPLAARRASREVVVAPRTRMLFVLAEGLTVETPVEPAESWLASAAWGLDPEEIYTAHSWGRQGRHVTFSSMLFTRVSNDHVVHGR
jgi:hypothetical protein